MCVDKNVYECALYSITPDIRVNRDWSKKTNILNADKKAIMRIMVLPTFRKNFCREIITGILIPIYRVHFSHAFKVYDTADESADYYSVPSTPYFIRIREGGGGVFTEYGSDLKIASVEEIKKYIEKHSSNPGDLKKELYEIFKIAEEYYEQAYSKNEYSDEHQVKSLLKTLKRK